MVWSGARSSPPKKKCPLLRAARNYSQAQSGGGRSGGQSGFANQVSFGGGSQSISQAQNGGGESEFANQVNFGGGSQSISQAQNGGGDGRSGQSGFANQVSFRGRGVPE